MNKKLAYLLPVRCVVFAAVFIIASAVTGKTLEDISSIWSVVASLTNIVLILALLILTKKDGGFLKLINYEKGKTRPGQVAGMIMIILLAGMGLMYTAGFLCYGKFMYTPPAIIAPIHPVLAVINLIVLPVTTALAEDALYLGCGVGLIRNKYAAIIAPAFFFALQHCFIPTLLDARYIIYRFLSFLPLTVFLCIHYRRNRNPLPIMVGHAVIDVATSGIIFATSVIPGFYDMMCSM